MSIESPQQQIAQPLTGDFVSPSTGAPLRREANAWVSADGESFPIVAGVCRFCEVENYSSSFGQQWNLFERTQIDLLGISTAPSADRLFAETGWTPKELRGLDILEVGSGAGRFSRSILEHTEANLFSIDSSTAVEANWRNNATIGGRRFVLAQASIYEMPFPNNRFDRVFCLGVLQHTPYFERSVQALIQKAKHGAEIVVDFYPINGFWTKIHSKYLLRPITKRMDPDRLLRLIHRNVDWLIAASNLFNRLGLSPLRRFLPVADIQGTMPPGLNATQLREWVILDTFDMFSPEHDHPQRIESVVQMFERGGADVTFAGFVNTGSGKAAVVRATKRQYR